jgi:hypothetical protein
MISRRDILSVIGAVPLAGVLSPGRLFAQVTTTPMYGPSRRVNGMTAQRADVRLKSNPRNSAPPGCR